MGKDSQKIIQDIVSEYWQGQAGFKPDGTFFHIRRDDIPPVPEKKIKEFIDAVHEEKRKSNLDK